MYHDHTVAVVVPAFNEEHLIRDTLQSVPSFVDRIYVVNDASTDATGQIIDEIAKNDPRVAALHHERNRGVGAAVVTGYKECLKEGIEVCVVMDGDNQMDPGVMPSLINPIIHNKADYTKGNRLLNITYRRGMSSWRFLGNTILTFLTKFSSGYWNLMDPQNGYTAISKRALERLNLDYIFPRYGYLNDILVKLNVFGFRVMNIEMPARYGNEKSKIKYTRYIITVSWVLLRDFFYRLVMKYVLLSFHPLVIFYLFGSLLTLISIFFGIYTMYWILVLHGPIFMRVALSLLLFAIGIMFISFALLFDIQENRDLSKREWNND